MNITDFPLKPEQSLRCQQVVSKHTMAAQDIFLLKLFSLIELIALVTIVVFEAALFFHIFAYINEDGNGAISGNMLGLTGLIALLTFHIVATEYEDSAPVRITRGIVFTMLPFFILGAGVLFAASLSNGGLEEIFVSSDLETESSLMAELLKNYILPNAVMIIVIGMSGFTAFCVFSASKLLKDLKENIKKINALSGKAKYAEQLMQTIINCQTEHALQCAGLKREQNNLAHLPEKTAQKVAIMNSKAVGTLDNWVMRQELSPMPDNSDKSPLDVLFDLDDPMTIGIKTMPLDILKQKSNELKALDQVAIVSILH